MKKIVLLPLLFISLLTTAQTKIIGNPVKIENLEVVQFNFPNSMNWADAIKACEALGDGWKLPTKDQLNTLYKNKEKIGGFANDAYWSATNNGDYDAWRQYFSDGDQVLSKKEAVGYVRAIREVEGASAKENKNEDGVSEADIEKYLEQQKNKELNITTSTDTEFGELELHKGIPFTTSINTASDKIVYTNAQLIQLNKPIYVIGKPIQIGKILVAENEFPIKSDWASAKLACQKLGPGWRLPTKDELYILYQNKNKLHNFSKYGYWSSTEGNMEGTAWFQDFYLGSKKPSLENKKSFWGVRAVKSL